MRSAIAASILLSLAGLWEVVASAETQSEIQVEFDALAAWDEFERLLRQKYAYIERADIDVEAQMVRSKVLAARASDKAALRRIMHQTALTFGDPHLMVGPLDDDDFAVVMTSSDIDARFIGVHATITDVRRGSPAFMAGLRTEDRIISIDDVPVHDAAMRPYGQVLQLPSAAQLDFGLLLAANGKRAGERLLEVADRSGMVRRVKLPNTRNWAISLEDRPLLDIAFVGQGMDIAHITLLNSLGDNATIDAFDVAMRTAAAARGIILDLRETPSGGNTEVARSIIGHFIAETRPYQMHRIPAIEREFSVPRQFVEYAAPRHPFFRGPVIVLHGRWTGSMGEGLVIGMDEAAQAITVGSNMGDLLGALWNFDLELSGAKVDLGGESLFHVDGTPREDYVADYPVSPASTAVDGSDPALSKAIALLKKD